MLNLHVIQADYGDCLLLEYRKQASPKFILIDGGPSNTYTNHLKYALKEKVSETGRLDLIVLSHIDNDHIYGIINFLKHLKIDRKLNPSQSLQIDGIWHNSFKQNIGIKSDIASNVLDLAEKAENRGLLYSLPEETVRGFRQGDQTSKLAEDLGIQLNNGFEDRLILYENSPAPWVMDDMKIWIIGPNRQHLERLQTEWLEWLEENVSEPVTRAGKDTSIPNLSSIMLLVEAGGRRIMLPGDGTGEDILEGLQNLGKIDPSGKIHVDILKLPHHGSMRNVSGEFFEKVTADLYVISANKNNPDFETLEWIVTSAQRQNRRIQILATNETKSTQELLQKYNQHNFGYTMIYMEPGQHFVTV